MTLQFYKLDQLGYSIWKSKFMNTNEVLTTFSKVLLWVFVNGFHATSALGGISVWIQARLYDLLPHDNYCDPRLKLEKNKTDFICWE